MGERVYEFARAAALVHDDGPGRAQYVRTEFDDRHACDGVPSFGVDDFERAARLGYEQEPDEHEREHVWRMHRDHEVVHTAVAEAAGLPYSPALRYAVVGPPRGVIPMEEHVVLFVQRLVQALRSYGAGEAEIALLLGARLRECGETAGGDQGASGRET